MSGGGGDGGAKEAQRQEQRRQARIQEATRQINAIFDGQPVDFVDVDAYLAENPDVAAHKIYGTDPMRHYEDYGRNEGRALRYKTIAAPEKTRQQMYDEQRDAVLDLNKRDIDRQYAQAERQNRFGLARAGLMGGSADIDSNAELQEKTSEGLIKAAALADGAAADLKTQDERTRQSLISMAQSGTDATTAQTMALRGLDANAQAAQGARQGAMVGNLFNDMSQAYLMRQMGAGMNAGRNQNQQWYGVSAPQQTYAGNVT